jgi:peroxiredoxin
MSITICGRIAAIAVLPMCVGCQAGANSPAPVAMAKLEQTEPQPSARPQPAGTLLVAKSEPKVTGDHQPGPKEHTAFFRVDAKPSAMPKVVMSKGDEAACKIKVGDAMPQIELPKLGSDSKTKLADLLGKKATVVVFWKGDRRMGQQQLADLGKDVVQPFGKEGVSVVGVAVDQSAREAQQALKKAGATFTNLNDADGKAFALMGTGRFPRTYVLDPSGKIVWFDIEYSMATRRELHQALRTLAASK